VSIRIILVDDQELVRTGFRMVLEAQPDMTVAGEAADGLAAVEMARRHPADVVVMDVRMPRLDGVEATRRICAAGDPALRGFTVASGHLPGGPGQVAMDTSTAADEHFRLGQTVKVVDHTGRILSFRLVGTIDLGVDHEFGDSTVTAFQTATGFAVTGRPGYDQIVARAAAGTSQAALTATIAALPGMSRYQVQTGGQLATSEANAAVQFTQQFTSAILVFALIALVVACIVIYNTFTILITQRGRELALLRCVGASRGQVFRSTLLESAIVGLIASAAGVLAGLGLGWGLQRLFAGFGAGVPSGPVVLKPSAVAISMAAGLVVTVAAAVIPARSATRVAPVAALGGQHEQPTRAGTRWLRVAAAVAFAGAGILATFTGLRHVSGESGFVEIAAGGCLCFLAVLALGPLIVPPGITFLGWLPGRLTGPVGVSVRPAMISGSLAAIGPGTVGVDSGQLTKLGAHQGGTLVIRTPSGTSQTLRVAAVYDSAGLTLPDVLMSVSDYTRAFRPAGADMVFVNRAPGASVAASRAAIDAATASDPLLVVNTIAAYKATLASRVNQILTLFGALLGLAVLIALLGISNTLSLSVIERTRESALMRALGLTRGQLRRMLLTEALLMAALAIVLGAGLGVTFGVVMVHAFVQSTDGQGLLSIPYTHIALYAAIAVCAALAAAALPARRAARTSVVSAMAQA
jgi:ABC-type antimicrobial peptide transport system permease subunit